VTQPAPTQSQHPWRATVRTAVAAIAGLIVLLPAIVEVAGIGAVPWVAAALGVTGTITRVLAIPGVIEWVRKHAKWLAPDAPAN
jgi:hypothetical protein